MNRENTENVVASSELILLMLVEEGINHYRKSIRKRLLLSKDGGYCCTIYGVKIIQFNDFNFNRYLLT